ncbi:MAG: hypothetical protein PHD01_02500 [Geobacteraceae bacterium]|nr:hypothetical protein [Geobacteraceae bacterium]
MKRYTLRLFLTFCVVIIVIALAGSESFALDPLFELDTKVLHSKNQKTSQSGPPVSKAPAAGVPNKKQQTGAGSKRLKVKHGSHGKTLRNSLTIAGAKEPSRVKRKLLFKTASSGMVVHSFHMAAGSDGGIKWTRKVWDRILLPGRHQNGPLVVQGSNYSLSLDPDRYPVFPAADGGRIIIDAGMTLSPLIKTILREKDPGIRIVSENPDDRKRFFSSLLKAAKFYSVEENFSVDFGSDPKLAVSSDFKIEKTPESLMNNDVVLVNVAGNSRGMPTSLISFLEKEGFHVIGSAPPISEAPDGRKMLYRIEGSSQDSIVDDLFSALSTPCEKNKNLVLDDGALSGVTLSVRADRYSESNNGKIVVSFSEENPVQYTLLRLLELKGYRVVMLNPEDDFREISEKVLSSLGLPAVYGMQPLWVPDGTPFNVQLSGFVVVGSGRNGMRRFLTNVPIDPLVRALAQYKGFDVIVK